MCYFDIFKLCLNSITITKLAFSFSNFSTTASILEILPYLKLWYFFNHHFRTGYEFSWIYYVLWVVQYADQCLQIAWLCNILDVAGPPDYLAIPNFYIISKHTKIDHNSHFGQFWEDLHENKKMYIQACQSVTSQDTLSKSTAMQHLLIALLNIERANKYIYIWLPINYLVPLLSPWLLNG